MHFRIVVLFLLLSGCSDNDCVLPTSGTWVLEPKVFSESYVRKYGGSPEEVEHAFFELVEPTRWTFSGDIGTFQMGEFSTDHKFEVAWNCRATSTSDFYPGIVEELSIRNIPNGFCFAFDTHEECFLEEVSSVDA